MHQPALTYYFSTGSRYSYLSMSQVPGIEARLGVDIDWVPVNGKRIRALRGADPFSGPPQSGQYDWGYREHDAKAWASYYNIAFVEPQDVEFDVECLLAGVIAAARQGDIRAYAWALAEEVFAHGTWPLDQAVVDRVALQHDLDMDRFAADCADPATRTTLEANCADAVARGAFGTPSLFVGEDLYWGNDRLVLFEQAALAARGAAHPFSPLALDHVVLSVADPESLVLFYEALLGARVERVVGDFLWQLRVGGSLLDIIRAREGGAGQNMDHFCLRVAPFEAEAILKLAETLDAPAEVADSIYGAQGYGPSIYVTDPAGNRVELKAAKARR